MLETLAGWNEDTAEGVFAFEETVERSTTAIISPGARYAFNLPSDAQLVIGAALPIGLTSDSPDWGRSFTAHSSIHSRGSTLPERNEQSTTLRRKRRIDPNGIRTHF
jgi:hypothetical protein